MYKRNIVNFSENGRYFIVRIKGIVIILILDLILNFEWYNMFVICIVREFGKWYFCFFRVILKCYGF